MDNKALFNIESAGYNKAEVERYVSTLKEEYKKVYEYAKSTEANNEKLKKICRALSEENKALKANGAVPAAPVAPAAPAAPASNAAAVEAAEKMSALIAALSKENEILKAKLN